jgi:hypothetical protein
MHSEWYKNCTIRQKIAVVAAMIHGILFSLYGNCHDKIRALSVIDQGVQLETQTLQSTLTFHSPISSYHRVSTGLENPGKYLNWKKIPGLESP